MNKEKIVVILLLATIILSIASIVVTFSLNSSNLELNNNNKDSSGNLGNVNLVLSEPPQEDSNEVN
ncbi:hypothetical protein J4474_01230 [Candidatus Pacearchaeota archaeon]|nr:hypothetical protein [Candidatus Pacearchaeota archaeon]